MSRESRAQRKAERIIKSQQKLEQKSKLRTSDGKNKAEKRIDKIFESWDWKVRTPIFEGQLRKEAVGEFFSRWKPIVVKALVGTIVVGASIPSYAFETMGLVNAGCDRGTKDFLRADYESAESSLKGALSYCKTLIGTEWEQLNILNLIANVKETSGSSEQARVIYDKILFERAKLEKDSNKDFQWNSPLSWYKFLLDGFYKTAQFRCDNQLIALSDVMSDRAGLSVESGELKSAEEDLKKVISVREIELGANSNRVLDARANLGVVLEAQGRFEEALFNYERALKGYETNFGLDSVQVARTLKNMGRVYREQGKIHEAEVACVSALQNFQKHLKSDHPDVIGAEMELALVWLNQNKSDQAEKVLREFLEWKQKQCGNESHAVASASNNLGIAVLQRIRESVHSGRPNTAEIYKPAEDLFRRAYAIRERLTGPNSLALCQSIINLGSVLMYQGRYREAEQAFDKGIKIVESNLGHDSVLLGDFFHAKGELYSRCHNDAEEEKYLLQALPLYKAALGLNHPAVEQVLLELSTVYERTGRKNLAKQVGNECSLINQEQVKTQFFGAKQNPALSPYLDRLH